MGHLEKHQRIGPAFRRTHGVGLKPHNQGNIPFFQRDDERGCGVPLCGQDVQQVPFRQFRAQYLKGRREAVGDGRYGPRLSCRIVKHQRCRDIGRGKDPHRRSAGFQRDAHRACVQCRRYGQQGTVSLIRAFPVLLDMPFFQRQHLPQGFFKQGLGILFWSWRGSSGGRLPLLRRFRMTWRLRRRLGGVSRRRHRQRDQKKQCEKNVHGNPFHANAITGTAVPGRCPGTSCRLSFIFSVIYCFSWIFLLYSRRNVMMSRSLSAGTSAGEGAWRSECRCRQRPKAIEALTGASNLAAKA